MIECNCSPLVNCRCDRSKPNPLPVEPSTIDAHIEWLNLRIRTLNQLANTDEKDLILETLALMEGNLRGIRSHLNSSPEGQTATPDERTEGLKNLSRMFELAAESPKVANKTERGGKWPKFSPFI